MELGKKTCCNCIAWNASCTIKIFPYHNGKTMHQQLQWESSFMFEVFGKHEDRSFLLWVKTERTTQSGNCPCKAFLASIPLTSKRFVLLENSCRYCLQELWKLSGGQGIPVMVLWLHIFSVYWASCALCEQCVRS